MRRVRLLRAALAAAITVTALSPLGSTAGGVTCPGEARRTRPDGWTLLNHPAYTSGPQEVRAWAASPFVDGFLLATNGDSIARSLDGGCSWEEVYAPGVGVGENRFVMSGQSVYDVAMPPSPPGRLAYTVYALIGDFQGTRVATSNDLGETWTDQPSAGLPPLAGLISVNVAADPRTTYVLADWQSTLNSLAETALYVTHDGGATFAPVERGIDVKQYTRIAVDPIDPASVWGWDTGSLYHSTNGGTTFAEVDVNGPLSTVDVSHYPAFAPARVIAYRKDRMYASRSTNSGLTWTRETTAGHVTGTANVYGSDALATTSERGVFIDVPSLAIVRRNVSPRGLVLKDLAWARAGGLLALYGGNGKNIYRQRFTPQYVPPKPPKVLPVDLHPGDVLKQGPTSLSPKDKVLRLKPGEHKTVTYTLNLSPVPSPLDIFFATDSTGSMSSVIAGLRSSLQDIIDDLADSGIDVWFGVGDFKDYPTFGQPTDHPYKRYREVGPIDDELEDAIANIEIGGGNGLDSGLTATYQAATGEGQRRLDVAGDKGGFWVEPGQGAEWREDAMKVLVIAADVRSRDPQNDPGYPGPSYRTVIDTLNRLKIEHVGLAVGSTPDEPFQSLSRVSRGTGTVAPDGGTDCDDDGEVDVAPGQPLVCKLAVSNEATNLAPAMIGLLRSLEDLQTVSVALRGDRRVVRPLGDVLWPEVNVKAPNRMTFQVEARCDAATAGDTYKVNVAGTVGRRTVAGTTLTVACAPLPLRQRPAPDVPPPAVRVLVAAAVPPPPPPPAPIPQTQPQPNPNPNPNPNPQPVHQAGMAAQEQNQVELALAHNDIETGEELAMTGLRDGDAAARGVLAGGMVLAAGAAVALRRRTRTAPVRVRSSG